MSALLEAAEAMAMARSVAGEAAALLRTVRFELARVGHKSNPRDLVTEWDTRSEELIRARLAALTPAIPILGEESSAAAGSPPDRDARAGYRWIVDPLDGTVNFAHGLPIYAVTIALELDGEAITGVVHAPVLDWQFYGHQGGGAFMNGERMAVSPTATLDRALLATGFPYDRATNPDNNFAEWCHFQRTAGACRRIGVASLDLCMVAQGWMDGYWERGLMAWDMSAGALFVREAGGAVSAYDGGPFDSSVSEVLASNGLIHGQLVAELAAVRATPGKA